MNRIQRTFDQKKKNILSIYFTAGQCGLNTTVDIIKELENNNVDMIEIGIPFSDPVADGPIIQKSSEKAINNGMTLIQLFKELEHLRKDVSIPVLLMGYLNPIIQYGIEEFCKKCNEVGVDGVIVPDLPLDIYINQYKETFEKYNITNTLLITPQTSDERIKLIDEVSNGFIYVVSSNGTTGDKKAIQNNHYFQRIKELKLNSSTLIGFGIKDQKTFLNACKYADGAIIGSSFVNHLEKSNNSESIKDFVNEIVEQKR